MRIPRWMLGAAAIVAAVLPGQLSAQGTTGAVSGLVVNEQNQPLDGVQVQVVNASTGSVAGAWTRADGRYYVQGLEIGDRYRVTARRIGYAPRTIEPVRVTLGQATPINFTLTVRVATLEAVTVQAAAASAIISPTQKGSQTTITDTLLRKLPTLNRTFTDFVQLTPQVSTSGPGLSAAGANNRYNNIQIDGATEKDLFGLGSTGQPGGQAGGKSIGTESVKEYQVLLAPYDVRVGNFSGLSINAVTKSGTNDVTGSAYVYGRSQNLQRSQPYINQSSQKQYGIAVGGPIVQDKAFFFINPEWQSKGVPAGGPALGDANTKVTQPLIDDYTSRLGAFGLTDLGTGDRVTNQNPLTNIFARLDFALGHSSTLIIRDNYAHAEQQVFSRGTAGASPTYGLTSNLYHFTSDKQAPVAQLRTNFSNGSYNELIAGYTRIRDARATPGTLQPQISTVVSGTATLVAGTEQSSQANQLDQDIQELTDNYTFPVGSSHRITIGTQNQWYKVRNLFGQNLVGAWTFGSLDSLSQGLANRYQVGVPVTGDGAVRFKAGQFAGYVQDDFTATSNLNLSFGVRFDNPVFFDKPPLNPAIALAVTGDSTTSGFGRNTNEVPSGNLQISPRFGFNWNVTGDERNQVRGGLGVFQGSPAYVWLSNSFQNSGGMSGFASLTCSRSATSNAVPLFTSATAAQAPQTCSNGTSAAAGSEVDLLAKDLKFPQTLRGNLAYDHDLGNGYVAGVEALYTHFLNNLFYYNLALQDAPIGTGNDGRSLYGLQPGAPRNKVKGRSTVLDVMNESQDYSYSFTGQIQKRFTTNFGGAIAYTYTQAYDVQSLTSSTAFSQYRFGRIYSGDQRDLTLAHSSFETPHRIVANGSYSFPSGTSVSAIYTGQSGVRYAYVSSNDLNGDGQTLNDPIYIPTGPTDPKAPVFQSTTGVTASPAQQAAAFDNFISSQPCLNSQRGQIMSRNSCSSPWTNQIDLSVEQALRTVRGQNVSLRLDVFNFGNLLNSNWGRQISSSQLNPITMYTASGLALAPGATGTANLTNGVPKATFDPNFNPYNYDNVFSNYTMQLGLRYSF